MASWSPSVTNKAHTASRLKHAGDACVAHTYCCCGTLAARDHAGSFAAHARLAPKQLVKEVSPEIIGMHVI